MAVADRVARGEKETEARREAMREFGNVPLIEDVTSERWRWMWLEQGLQDVRYALRTLGRDRGFTLVAVLILALGIGANIVVFSVVNTILLRPLPFKDSQQLVWLAGNEGKGGLSEQTYTVDVYEEFQRHNRSFQSVTSYQTFYNSIQYKLTGSGDPKALVGVEVADNFFPTLGVRPALGRNFSKEECQKNGRPAAMLSYFFWQRQFGGDPSIIGKAITINKLPVTVVGVLPESFDFGAVFAPGMKVDFFAPAVMDFWRTWGNTLAIVGRLKPGVTAAQSQDEASRLFPEMRRANPKWYSDYKSTLTGLKEHVSGKLHRSLVVLWAAVGLDPADCLREPFKPAIGAGGNAHKRICDEARARRGTRTADTAIVDGKPDAFHSGRGAGALHCIRDAFLFGTPRLDCSSAIEHDSH